MAGRVDCPLVHHFERRESRQPRFADQSPMLVKTAVRYVIQWSCREDALLKPPVGGETLCTSWRRLAWFAVIISLSVKSMARWSYLARMPIFTGIKLDARKIDEN